MVHARPQPLKPTTQLSDLPSHMLCLILEKLTGEFGDILSCLDVCISWRSLMVSLYTRLKRSCKPLIILGEKTPVIIQHDTTSNNATISLPILPEKEPPTQQILHLFDTVSTKSYAIHLPQLSSKWFHGCSNGWLLTMSPQFPHEARFLNPLSRCEVMLPSLGIEFDKRFRVVTSSRDPSDSDCVVLGAVLEPVNGVSMYRHDLLFCNPLCSQAWKKVMVDVEVDGIIWHDIILHKNQFYAVSNKFLYRITLDGHAKKLIALPPIQEDPIRPLFKASFYLVEFDGELLLVVMTRYRFLHVRLKIYKLKLDDLKLEVWVEIKDLCGNVLYLGTAHSVAMIAREVYYNSVIFFLAEMPHGISVEYDGSQTMNFYQTPDSTKPVQWFPL